MHRHSPRAGGWRVPITSSRAIDTAAAILAAAHVLLPRLEGGRRVDAAILRAAMETAFGASDASGAWAWKTAYDACEAATVLLLRKYGKAILCKAGPPAAALPLLAKIAALLPTHTRRSAEGEAFQRFSTPLPLGLAALTAAAVRPGERVLEPSAGTGLLAVLAEIAGGALILNELADARADLISRLFPAVPVTRFDAAPIDDHLDPRAVPSVVLNPPFSAMANVSGRRADAAFRHVASALARRGEGGRLVAITGANFSSDASPWAAAFVRLQERGRVVFTAAVDGAIYAKHGTTIETRLTVIDKVAAEDPTAFPASPGAAPDVATLIGWIGEHVPPRPAVISAPAIAAAAAVAPKTARSVTARAASGPAEKSPSGAPETVELACETVDWRPAEGARLSAYGLFHDIVSWKLRMFVPADANGLDVLAKVLERYLVVQIVHQEAAP